MTDDTITFNVSSPPSANRLWRNVPGMKRPVLDEKYAAWLRTAAWEVQMQIRGITPIACRYDAVYHVPVSRRDTDNWAKGIGDLCQRVGIVTNDGNLRNLLVQPQAGRTDCWVVLTPVPSEPGVRKAAKAKRAPGVRKARPDPKKTQAWARIQAGLR